MSKVYYEVYYHLIWTTKKRRELINYEVEKILIEVINGKCRELKAKLIEFNTYYNHCHQLEKERIVL